VIATDTLEIIGPMQAWDVVEERTVETGTRRKLLTDKEYFVSKRLRYQAA